MISISAVSGKCSCPEMNPIGSCFAEYAIQLSWVSTNAT